MGKEMAMMPADYVQWLADIKNRVSAARHKAALAVNAELVSLYWHIGQDILQRQAAQGWGSKVIDRLGRDLRKAFPEMKGFPRANLLYMRAFAEAWTDFEIVQQAVGQLPWGHNVLLINRIGRKQEMNCPEIRNSSNCTGLLHKMSVIRNFRATDHNMAVWLSKKSK